MQIANTNQVGFLVNRATDPGTNGRLNSIVFQDFCIDGVSSSKPYLPGNGKTGIKVQYDTDSLRVEGMGFVYLANALVVRNADAFNITNNFIAECGSAIQMNDGSIVGKVTNNYLISAWAGNSLFIENNENCVISGNSLLWGGTDAVQERAPRRHHRQQVRQQLLGDDRARDPVPRAAHLRKPLPPHLRRRRARPQRRSLRHGPAQRQRQLGHVEHVLVQRACGQRRAAGATPTVVLVKGGNGNYLATNKLVSNIPVRHVLDSSTTATKVLWSGTSSQLQDLTGGNMSFVATP